MKITKRKDRFVIADDNGEVIDDANGYGYKTKESARKAMWYKFKGGEEETKRKNKEKKEFFQKHRGLNKFLHNIQLNNFKEISRGEVTNQDIIDEVKREFGIDLPPEYIYGSGD